MHLDDDFVYSKHKTLFSGTANNKCGALLTFSVTLLDFKYTHIIYTGI